MPASTICAARRWRPSCGVRMRGMWSFLLGRGGWCCSILPLAPPRPPITHGMNSAHPRGADLSARGPRFVWCRHVPSSSAPPAATRRPSGWASAPAAGSGTRSTRRSSPPRPVAVAAGPAPARPARAVKPVTLAEVEAPRIPRLKTGIGELDRVLGGGARARLARAARRLARHRQVDADLDGARQPRRRRPAHALRLRRGVGGADQAARRAAPRRRARRCRWWPRPTSTTVLATLEAERPEVCVIDSVQTLHAAELTGAAGSVGQVREVADRITRLAKARNIAVLLVGHVTKEGALAGPRVLEHLVDCVLQFEGERERTYRTLRALKNRFGSTNEAGVFEMAGGGLVEVADASARFVGEATRAPGSVVLAAMEGSRPLLVEVQALVSPSELVPPRRVANGIDRNRLALVLAVLGRHAGVGDRQRRRVRQRRRRRAGGRAGRRPRGRARGGERPARRRGRRRRAARRLLRRARAQRRAALGRAPRPAPGRGGQVRAHAGDRPDAPRPCARRSAPRCRGRRRGRGPPDARDRGGPPALQALLDASYASAGEHLLRIHTPERRLTAEQVAERLQGMGLLALATVTADGRPIVGPGRLDLLPRRVRVRLGAGLDPLPPHPRRPAVSATHLPGEELSVTVHGRAVKVDVSSGPLRQALLDVYVPRYGESWASFMDSGPGLRPH